MDETLGPQSQRDLRSAVVALRSGTLTPTAYVGELCDRINAVEPEIQALLPEPGRRERLLRDATELESRYPIPEDHETALEEGWTAQKVFRNRPLLFGVPVGVKDIYRVDGFLTRAGSSLPAELFDGPEAPAVTRLRESGALILGKTVTTEFAYFQPGPTRNPQNPKHTPGGSSSGSAAAVAAGFCPLALGSQTVGSVIRPAAFCGVVGFKFSYGRVPLEGVIPYAPSLDHAGIFVSEAHDLALAVSILVQEEENMAPGWRRIGVPDGPYLEQASPEGRDAFELQVERLRQGDRTVVRIPVLEEITEINRWSGLLAASEMAETHWEWFPRYEALYSARTVARIREGLSVSPEEADDARRSRLALREHLEGVMADQGIDAWVCPAAVGPAPRGLENTGDPCMNLPWTHAGLPAATVPAGRAANGLPLGLQCVGRFGRDAWLAAFANQISQEIRPRSPAEGTDG